MRTQLTDDELTHYREQGFLVIPDFLTGEEVDELESAVLECIDRRRGAMGFDGERYGGVPAHASTQLVHLMNPFTDTPRIRKFSTDPRLAELTRTLEGIDTIRLYQDMIAVKPAWGGPTGFHMDVPRISFTSDHAVSYWFPLVDATLHNACLYYLPGLHRQKRADARDVYGTDALHSIDPSWVEVEPVAAPCPRGGVVLHEGYAPHGTNGNMSPRPRPAFVITHMPDGTTFDGTPNLVQPGEMPEGAPLDDDARFPIVLRPA